MEKAKKIKIVVGIIAGLAVGVGIYIGVTKLFKKKKEDEVVEETPAVTDDKTISAQVSTPKSTPTPLTVKKPAAKANGFQEKPASTPKTVTTSKGGKKVWVYAKMDGVKLYRKSTKAGVNLGPLYNTYNKGKIIGTLAGSTSVGGEKYLYVNDGATPLIVSEKLVYTNTI